MQFPHHLTQRRAGLQIAKRVAVVLHQRRDEREESVHRAVMK
jgi:hypothetical protein